MPEGSESALTERQFAESRPQTSPEREPAAEPFFAEPDAAPAAEEPQRVFHRVFDRPRDQEPSPSAPATDAPHSDDHEPSQS